MIGRLWRGWTVPEQADACEALPRTVILPGIAARGIPGYRGVHLLRRSVNAEVEFVTLLWFDSRAAVVAFAGVDHARAVVPDAACQLLSRHDARSAHFAVLEGPRGDA